MPALQISRRLQRPFWVSELHCSHHTIPLKELKLHLNTLTVLALDTPDGGCPRDITAQSDASFPFQAYN